MVKIALDWGGLNSFPVSLDSITVESKGGLFTRQFIIGFSCSEDAIKEWIYQSKRLCNNAPVKISDGVIKYNIYPGEEGAIGGYVQINYKTKNVSIDMSWS